MIISGATPLASLDAVGFDTETTGLDASRDRIVQIGAVAIRRGTVASAETFERLVDPGAPIPPASTAIHHITSAMVRGKPRFAEVWPAFETFASERVLVGHSIGFDLAVLAAEAGRAGIQWRKPRSLCVRLLAATVNSRLPDYSLEAIASWLGIAISGRHEALGDARSAADILVALMPRLDDCGIRTLAEAERAVLGLTEQLDSHHHAGWAPPVTRPDAARVFVTVDPYAYRHRVAHLMSAPVVIASIATVGDTMRLMLSRRISSVFVCVDGRTGRPMADYGIVTERDMMRHLDATQAGGFAVPVRTLATHPIVSIRAAAFAYRAIGRMDRLNIRHLAVRDDDDRLIGIVSARDLLKLRATAAINLDDAIQVASSAIELAAAWASLPSVVQALIAESVEPPVIAEIISEELCAMTRRAALLAETEMQSIGFGPAPCSYAVLVLGSGGRGESLLAPDQDNAIVFAEGNPDSPADRWFASFGEKFNELLDRSSIPLCNGGVMARNPRWRGSLATWRTRVADWVRRSRPEDLLNVDIFFDMRAVFGDRDIAAALRSHAYFLAEGQIPFAKALGERVAQPINAFSLLGGFRTEAGRIDLKRHGLFPVVAFARALAIRHGVRALSTRDRLAGLSAAGIGSTAELTRMANAHAIILKFMLRQQSRDLLDGIRVSNSVKIGSLSSDEQATLKGALKTIRLVPDLVRTLMF